MRRIVTFNHISADGYFAATDGNLNWVVPDHEVAKAGANRMPAGDTILFGRRTYQLFEAFWPHALDDSSTSPDPHNPERRSETMRDMAVWINNASKVVFSRTLEDVTWKNARVVREFDPREIEAMKNETGQDMMVFGSGSIASQLTEHGLVDEYQFVVSPVLLGSGQTLLRDVSHTTRLHLLEAREFQSQVVMLRYAPSR